MSAYEDEATVDMNKIPTRSIERAYWRRKLPPAFRFYLEMLARELMLSQPANIYAHAAGFFEELLIQRDTELSLQPYVPYFDKLKMSAAGGAARQPPTRGALEEPRRPPGGCAGCSAVRCGRCGRFLKGGPGDGSSTGAGPSGSVCSSTTPGPGAGPSRSRVTETYRHLEGDNECRVMALPVHRDAFGRLATRQGNKDDDLITCRSLAYIVDF
ncbi:uncharacterized protein [Littorina saxatilis]|uniref:Uncharacterized protein n=1 Tax=Littorina saxatilis TaxID=31220 RepID=A0AAN9GQ82_9CAEN